MEIQDSDLNSLLQFALLTQSYANALVNQLTSILGKTQQAQDATQAVSMAISPSSTINIQPNETPPSIPVDAPSVPADNTDVSADSAADTNTPTPDDSPAETSPSPDQPAPVEPAQ